MEFYVHNETCRLEVEGDFPEDEQEAIKAAIQKWETIRDWHLHSGNNINSVSNIGVYTCALCNLYRREYDDGESCFGCPVAKRTGNYFCEGSPLDLYDNGLHIQGATEEVEFLKSLLNENQAHSSGD